MDHFPDGTLSLFWLNLIEEIIFIAEWIKPFYSHGTRRKQSENKCNCVPMNIPNEIGFIFSFFIILPTKTMRPNITIQYMGVCKWNGDQQRFQTLSRPHRVKWKQKVKPV